MANPAASEPSTNPAPRSFTATGMTHYRWVICGLLFFATTFNYLDRQVISYLKTYFCTPTDKGGFGWSDAEYSYLVSAFTAFYAGMTIGAGWIIDKIGTKLGLALSLIVWSIFGIGNAFVGRLVVSHLIVRSAFGIGEAGNFPASIKTVAEWFPKRERALATGIFNSGTNFGAMLAALFVPWCLIHYDNDLGWKMAFIWTGLAGFIWLIFWYWLYDTPAKQKRLSQAEYEYIHSDRGETELLDATATKRSANIFSFSGRIPRGAYWGMTIMVHLLCGFIYSINVITRRNTGQDFLAGMLHNIFGVMVVGLILAVPVTVILGLHVRRWHDLNRSGLLAMTYLIPVVAGFITALVWGFGNIICLIAAVAALISMGVVGLKGGTAGNNHFGTTESPGLLGYRQTWAFFSGKFLTDGVWWFYLFWLPDYLHTQFKMGTSEIRLPTFTVYGVAIIGSVYGGSIPMRLIKRGMPVYKARMMAMLLIALFPLVVMSTQYFGDVARFGTTLASQMAVAVICIGAAAHQAWSANLFTTVSDMFPKKSVGSVTGIGAMAGGLGGVLVQLLQGDLKGTFRSNPQQAYLIMFGICSVSYLIAWGVMKALVPRHSPITEI